MNSENAYRILDIHTHKPERALKGIAILNEQIADDAPLLCIPSVFCSVGIHPWDLTEQNAVPLIESLRSRMKQEGVVAIGEVGLDKLASVSWELQIAVFKKQIELSETYALPLIIHCVKAMDELLALRKEYHPLQPWIWHGFRGKLEQAQQLLQKEFYLSFGEHYQEEALRMVPDECLFLETDESQVDVEELLHKAAKMRGVEVETLRETVRRNIRKVFFRV